MSDIEEEEEDFYEYEEVIDEVASEKSSDEEEIEQDEYRTVQSECSTSRNIIIVPPEERITSENMTQFEFARAIAIRASQIANNPKIYTDYDGLYDEVSIAKKELLDRKSPLIIWRQVGVIPTTGERIIEKWNVREMVYPM